MHPELPIRRILIAFDLSDSSRFAFYSALKLAKVFSAEVWALHVAEPLRASDFAKKRYVDTKETIERVEEGIRGRLDELWQEEGLRGVDRRRVHILVRGGKAAYEIVETAKAKGIDLVVMGAGEASGGIGALLGSTAERVLRHAPCSVFCVRLPA